MVEIVEQSEISFERKKRTFIRLWSYIGLYMNHVRSFCNSILEFSLISLILLLTFFHLICFDNALFESLVLYYN